MTIAANPTTDTITFSSTGGGGGFSNGQSISVTDLVVTGTATISGFETKATANSRLANTNSRVSLVNTNLTGTNTALRTLISDRLQVANAATLYVTKVNPATSGLLAHTGRVTVSTNLAVTGNTTVSGLIANGSLGTANFVLKTNGTTAFWGAAAAGGSSTILTKTLDYTGPMVVGTGTKKWWINRSYSITRIIGFLDVAPTGSSLILQLNKNGANTSTLTVAATKTTASANLSISVVQGDYITVNVMQIGSTNSGRDLSLMLEYS
jgi:hypothetical protein